MSDVAHRKRTNSEWLSLHDVAEMLGVHPSTVRAWSNKGTLPVHRTQGGHRRFKRSEVALWAETSHKSRVIEPEGMMQEVVKTIRVQITEGRLESESWYQKLDEEARGQYRQSARSLLRGLMTYLGADDQEGAFEAYAIGYEYASRARRYKLSYVDAAQAFLFFRNALLQSVIQIYQGANVPSGQAWGEILGKINAFTDLILLHLLETYQSMGNTSP